MQATLKNVGERSTAKSYYPVSLLSVVSKVFEKLLNNNIKLLKVKKKLWPLLMDGVQLSQGYSQIRGIHFIDLERLKG